MGEKKQSRNLMAGERREIKIIREKKTAKDQKREEKLRDRRRRRENYKGLVVKGNVKRANGTHENKVGRERCTALKALAVKH